MSKSYILIIIKTFSGLHISTTTTLENIFVINTIYEFNLEISKFLERLLILLFNNILKLWISQRAFFLAHTIFNIYKNFQDSKKQKSERLDFFSPTPNVQSPIQNSVRDQIWSFLWK